MMPAGSFELENGKRVGKRRCNQRNYDSYSRIVVRNRFDQWFHSVQDVRRTTEHAQKWAMFGSKRKRATSCNVPKRVWKTARKKWAKVRYSRPRANCSKCFIRWTHGACQNLVKIWSLRSPERNFGPGLELKLSNKSYLHLDYHSERNEQMSFNRPPNE